MSARVCAVADDPQPAATAHCAAGTGWRGNGSVIGGTSPAEWRIREAALDLDELAWSESVFALSNGHIGLRGNLDEGEPHGLPGSYLNSLYELRPLPHAEPGYGYPEEAESAVNATNGKLIRLLVDDEPFDVRYGELLAHERVLDLRAGTLERTVEWVSPAGQAVRVRSTRLVSFTQRAVAAVCYEVEAVDDEARIVVQSALVANEDVPATTGDPRAAAALHEPLQPEHHMANGAGGLLIHRTKTGGLLLAAGMSHVLDGPEGVHVTSEAFPDWVRTNVTCVLRPGERLRVVKLLAYGFSSQRSLPALRDQVGAALAAARLSGWDGLARDQREYLTAFWDDADIRVDGDPEIQQAVRFGLFNVLQAGARNEGGPIGAKGLTGPGYDGHAFWDTEMFVLPVLIYTQPRAAAQVLRWRHATLDLARERARALGLAGAAFPWRTIRGYETSGYWPAGTAAFHVNAAVADATMRYIEATGDEVFEREVGVDLLVETARLWRSLGHHDRHGAFHIDGVTGPDEYSALANDNVYTNLMAQRNLLGAAEAAARHSQRALALGVDHDELASWRDAANAMTIPYDEELDVHEQSAGFTRLQEWDFEATKPDEYPLLLTHPYFDLYRRQVCKQADLVLAMHWRGDAFAHDEKVRNFRYYEARTVRDSSLSACSQAVLAAETGHLDLAFDYLSEAALIDLHDSHANTRDGLHLASLAGAWIALVAGFGGMRDHGGELSFAPRLPTRITGLDFSIRWRGRRLKVAVAAGVATYQLDEGVDDDGSSLIVRHYGEPVRIPAGRPVSHPIPPASPSGPEPIQPPGRAPVHRTCGPFR